MATGDDAEVIAKVAERLAFFFSDANLRCDRWMKTELKCNPDHVLPISKLLNFNSIKKHTSSVEVVAKAAETERNKQILKLNADRTAIGRVHTFDIHKSGDNVPLSLVVNGIPTAAEEDGESDSKKKYDVGIEDIKNEFSTYGNVTLVRLRFAKRVKKDDPVGVPLGSAFVEFETEEMAKKAVDDLCVVKPEGGDADTGNDTLEPKTKRTLKGQALSIQTMREWIDKKEKKKDGAEEQSDSSPTKKRPHDGVDNEKDDEEKVEEDDFKIEWEKKCVIEIKGLPEDCDREAIRDAIQEYADKEEDDKKRLPYVDFSRGQKDGAIRFNAFSDKIEELAEKLRTGSVKIMGSSVDSATVLQGEEEEKYWAKFIEFKKMQRKQKTGTPGRKNKRGRR